MRVFGEEMGDLGRWYIALPPILLLGFLVGLFLLASAGQSRRSGGPSALDGGSPRPAIAIRPLRAPKIPARRFEQDFGGGATIRRYDFRTPPGHTGVPT